MIIIRLRAQTNNNCDTHDTSTDQTSIAAEIVYLPDPATVLSDRKNFNRATVGLDVPPQDVDTKANPKIVIGYCKHNINGLVAANNDISLIHISNLDVETTIGTVAKPCLYYCPSSLDTVEYGRVRIDANHNLTLSNASALVGLRSIISNRRDNIHRAPLV